jgi:four helix bundle protein
MSNIAEGYDRNGPAEFHHFLGIAKGSCAETLSLLYVAYDAGYIGRDTFSELRAQTDEVARVIGGLRVSQARRRKAQLTRQEQ